MECSWYVLGREPVKSLWIGDSLSIVEQICMKSFLFHGHPFILYVYGKKPNGLPKGVVIKEGNEILPESDIFYYSDGSNSPSGFSNRFRYKLLYDKGGWWVDSDVLCLKSLSPLSGIQFGLEDNPDVEYLANPAVMRFPRNHNIMRTCYELATESGKNLYWGQTGPRLFTEIIHQSNLTDLAHPSKVFHPIPWWEAEVPFDPERALETRERIKESYTLHLWNSKQNTFRKREDPLPINSFLYQFQQNL
jgi:hypothetical protein